MSLAVKSLSDNVRPEPGPLVAMRVSTRGAANLQQTIIAQIAEV
jgi:hypothetical protein